MDLVEEAALPRMTAKERVPSIMSMCAMLSVRDSLQDPGVSSEAGSIEPAAVQINSDDGGIHWRRQNDPLPILRRY